jgi:putative holliday junction resolvase
MYCLHLLHRTLPASLSEGDLISPILAIDYGSKNIGIAWSPDGIFAFPVTIIQKSTLAKDVEAIIKIIEDKKIKLVVLGYPFNENPTESTKRVDDFLAALKNSISLEIVLEDERITSVQIRQIGHAMGKNDKSMRDRKDALEAQLILTRYLERTTPRGFDDPPSFA